MSDLSKSAGQFGIPAGLVFSMPVSFRDGCWTVRSDVTVTDELRVKLDACADELKMVSHEVYISREREREIQQGSST